MKPKGKGKVSQEISKKFLMELLSPFLKIEEGFEIDNVMDIGQGKLSILFVKEV